jgi:predicted metal-dependent phosphotriesterase family hydrolase
MGFKKLIFCHPDSRTVGADMEHVRKMAEMNFFVEFTFLGLLPAFYRISIQEMARRIKEVGAERSILTTDSFFEWASPPSEMLRMFISSLLTQGITGDEIEMMVRKNPSELLNV